MFAYLDGEFMRKGVEFLKQGGNPKPAGRVRRAPGHDQARRIRSVYDGRYVFCYPLSPKRTTCPMTLEQLYALSDVELFDTAADPHEVNNLAVDRRSQPELAGDGDEREDEPPDRSGGRRGPRPDAAGRHRSRLGSHPGDDGRVLTGKPDVQRAGGFGRPLSLAQGNVPAISLTRTGPAGHGAGNNGNRGNSGQRRLRVT